MTDRDMGTLDINQKMDIWVDTDFGFDDLWALLFLKSHNVKVRGVSLVHGNAKLPQTIKNACAATQYYGLNWPLYAGADKPLKRPAETAERVLGPTGLPTRGHRLPKASDTISQRDAVSALCDWLLNQHIQHHVLLALGPLTNIAKLVQSHPKAVTNLDRLVWMGGSSQKGNHTDHAEFNAFADPEALAVIAQANLPMDIVDLTFCRKFTFGEVHMPQTDPVTADLLGAYLDIALNRGRSEMAIYDPLAAYALLYPDKIQFEPKDLTVSLCADQHYGQTLFTSAKKSTLRLAMDAHFDLSYECLKYLERPE